MIAASRKLEMVAQRGFDAAFLQRFDSIRTSMESAASGRAIAKRGRIMITDVNEDPVYKPLRAFAAEAGYRAVHSTPLFDRNVSRWEC